MKFTMKSLIHNGPVFPPEYQAKGYTFEGTTLPVLAEEMLYAWAGKITTDYVNEQIVIENFWKCLKPELKSSQVKNFPADYQILLKQMYIDIQAKKEAKKLLSKSEVKAAKAVAATIKAKYGTAMLDGKPQPLGGYLIEGPGIILTRGASPIKGMWKYRTMPEDVTINFVDPSGKETPPVAPAGHHWKKVVSSPTSAYAVNVGNVTFRPKSIRFGTGSVVALSADETKYKNAVKLLKVMPKLEAKIEKGMKSLNKREMESALVTYLVKMTEIRIGNDKDMDLDAD